MQLANQEAQRFGHEYIGTEHILLGRHAEGSGGSSPRIRSPPELAYLRPVGGLPHADPGVDRAEGRLRRSAEVRGGGPLPRGARTAETGLRRAPRPNRVVVYPSEPGAPATG